MKEEKDKKYNLILGLMIFFFILLVAVGVAYGLGIISINKINSEKKGEQNNTEVVSNNDTNTTNNTKLTVEQKKALIVTAVNVNEDKGKCDLGDCDLYLKANLPKINLNTATVKNINSKIYKIYQDAHDYYEQDFSKLSKGKSVTYDITNKSGYISKLDCIYVSVIIGSGNAHATGGTDMKQFLYLVDKDKEITLEELLKSQNITMDMINKKMLEKYDASSEDKTLRQNVEEMTKSFDYVYLEKLTEDTISLGVNYSQAENLVVDFLY